ncbi:MAG: hypothetical protein H8E13_12380 [Actinobacteria bacterium]|nr:hypothetical protein [Actinomycetota bacterium]
MIRLKKLIIEEIEYYFDKTKNNLEKYVAFDGTDYYTGRRGLKGEKSFLKFVLTHPKHRAIYKIKINKNKLKKVLPKEVEKDIGETLFYIDFKKLYKK